MVVYVEGIKGPVDSIRFDLYQGTKKKQTVNISITMTPQVSVTVDGRRWR